MSIPIDALVANRLKADVSTLPITAELTDCVRMRRGERAVIYGNIRGDKLGRFPDGMNIRTSLIVKEVGDIVVTLNSVYRVIGDVIEPEAVV